MLTRSPRVWAIQASLWLTLCLSPALTARGHEQLPAGADILERFIKAIGGEAAWREASSYRVTGRLSMPAQNVHGTFEILAARPSRLLIRMDIGGIGNAESAYNGDVGWILDPMAGPSLVSGAALAEMKNDAHFDGLLHPSDLVASFVPEARVEFDGKTAIKVAVTYVSGQKRAEYFDVESGLMIGTEGDAETPMGKVPTRTTLRNYKPYGAILQPSLMIQTALGIEQHFIVSTIEWNVVKPDAFDPPAVIKAIIKTETPEAAPAWKQDAIASFDDAWMTIRDSFHDPTFGGLDWEQVRVSLRPKVMAAATPNDARAVIKEMLAALKRSHFGLLTSVPDDAEESRPGEATPSIDVRLVGDQLLVTRVGESQGTEASGLRPGQRVLAIDDVHVERWISSSPTLDSRLASLHVWRKAHTALRGLEGSKVKLRLSDGHGEQTVTVERARPAGERVVLGDLPPFHVRVWDKGVKTPRGRPVGLVGFNVWMASANDRIAEAIDRHRGAAGLVIDLRGNPGGLAAMIRGVAGHMVTEPVMLGRMQMRQSDVEFKANPRVVMPDGRRVTPFDGPVVLLVDELTASASECFAGGLQSLSRVHVVGRTTAGQALPASTKRLANGDVLMYAVGDFVTGRGTRLEGVGVVPDDAVRLTPEALLTERDPDLEAALRWIDRQKLGD